MLGVASPSAMPDPSMTRPRLFLLLLLTLTYSVAHGAEGPAILLGIDGPIGPATSDFIERGLVTAAQRDAEIVIIEMDTPGGLDTSMRDIIKAIMSSPVPVATYVSPQGSRAASAGTYILYASHIAAMAPATNLGAATPVPVGGSTPLPGKDPSKKDPETGSKEGEGDGGQQEDDAASKAKSPPADASMAKVMNDSVAYIRSLAEARGRNADWAEKAVREAASLSANEALELGVIDLIADSVGDLLAAVDGRTIELEAGDTVLDTSRIQVERIEPDWRTEILATITNPTVAYLLLLVGLYGLLFEGYNPGAILPGVTGAICLLLAAYALQILPVNFAGLALILLGIALMVGEMFVPSFGALGIGGIVAFVVGSVILIDTDVPGFGVPLGLIVSIATAGGIVLMAIVGLAIRSFRRPVVSGMEQLQGGLAEVIGGFDDSGQVRVHGEIWSARTGAPLTAGQQVRITHVDGLTLTVESVDSEGS